MACSMDSDMLPVLLIMNQVALPSPPSCVSATAFSRDPHCLLWPCLHREFRHVTASKEGKTQEGAASRLQPLSAHLGSYPPSPQRTKTVSRAIKSPERYCAADTRLPAFLAPMPEGRLEMT